MADKNKLIHDLADAASMTPEEFIAVVKQRCFKDGVASDAQLILLLTIAHKYDLNPLAREIHAFINEKRGNAMEIAIGLDGWIKIATRHRQFDGYLVEERLNDKGELTAISMEMYRKDWKHPGVYTAWMDEWLVPSGKPGQTSNWEQYPRHRLFGKAFQECARFTFGITEAGEPDDLERIERAVVTEDVIHQLGPAEPKALEHSPAMPMADFRNGGDTREKEPAQPPLREGTGESIRIIEPPQLPKCLHVGCQVPSVGEFETKVGKLMLCAEHGELHRIKRRGRHPTAKVDGAATQNGAKDDVKEVVDGGGGQAGASEIPLSPSAPAAAEAPTLEAFIAAHGVPEKRIDLALAKYGAASLGELKPDEQTAILDVFRRSYAAA